MDYDGVTGLHLEPVEMRRLEDARVDEDGRSPRVVTRERYVRHPGEGQRRCDRGRFGLVEDGKLNEQRAARPVESDASDRRIMKRKRVELMGFGSRHCDHRLVRPTFAITGRRQLRLPTMILQSSGASRLFCVSPQSNTSVLRTI